MEEAGPHVFPWTRHPEIIAPPHPWMNTAPLTVPLPLSTELEDKATEPLIELKAIALPEEATLPSNVELSTEALIPLKVEMPPPTTCATLLRKEDPDTMVALTPYEYNAPPYCSAVLLSKAHPLTVVSTL